MAGIGLNWQANIEYTSWSEADEDYFAEINNARITDTNFEKVDESSLEISPTSLEANTARETVTFTSSSGTVTTEVVLLGITVGTLQDAVDIMAGSPEIQLKAVIQGDTTINWSLSSPTGSITPSGVYTPPATASSETTIRAIATSNADSTVWADTLIQFGLTGPPMHFLHGVRAMITPTAVVTYGSLVLESASRISMGKSDAVRQMMWDCIPALRPTISFGTTYSPDRRTMKLIITSTGLFQQELIRSRSIRSLQHRQERARTM